MECVLLGSGGMMPMSYRFLVSMALRYDGRTFLFDCGEGTQIPLKAMKLGIKPIKDIFISHLHADHVTGLPGMLMMLNQAEPDEAITVYGPEGIHAYIHAMQKTLSFDRRYPLKVEELHGEAGVAYEDGNVRVFYRELNHRVRCLGYAVLERDLPGRFNIDKARELGVPEGPMWGQLQRGETVTLDDGRTVSPGDVLGDARPGRKVAYATDTRPCEGVTDLAMDADLVFVEGMFAHELVEDANLKGHQTVVQAAEQMKAAGARRAVMVHFSPRYHNDDIALLEAEAQAVYPAMEAGRDGRRYVLKVKG
ncbi:MAG: ribonuclease Z [Deltaproteobacteria bacterium]|nr:ribonuclease Z [Deltaproteobacteria bacterium]